LATSLSLLSRRAIAEPITAGAVISIVVAAVKAAKKYSDDLNFTQWRHDVSDQLDRIQLNTEKILQDLQQLRVDFKIALHAEFRDMFDNRLEARRQVIETIIDGLHPHKPVPSDVRQRLDGEIDALKLDLFVLSQGYGFATLPFVLSGYTMLMTSMKLVGRSEGEIRATVGIMYKKFFGPAVDPNVEGSFAWARVQAGKYEEGFRAEITSNLRKGTVGGLDDQCDLRNLSVNEQTRGQSPCHYNLLTTLISGSPDDAASIGASPVKIEPPITLKDPNGALRSVGVNFTLPWNNDYQPRPFKNAGPLQYSVSGAQQLAAAIVAHMKDVAANLAEEKRHIAELTAAIDLIDGLNLDKLFSNAA
jgi:hypothetical protein